MHGVSRYFFLKIYMFSPFDAYFIVFPGFRFTDLTGTDYSEGAIDLAQSLANRDGFTNLNFLV